MPSQYLILTQTGRACEVIFYDSDKQTREVKFSGGRWAARHYLRELRTSIGWEGVVAFCKKKGRGKHTGRMAEMKLGEL